MEKTVYAAFILLMCLACGGGDPDQTQAIGQGSHSSVGGNSGNASGGTTHTYPTTDPQGCGLPEARPYVDTAITCSVPEIIPGAVSSVPSKTSTGAPEYQSYLEDLVTDASGKIYIAGSTVPADGSYTPQISIYDGVEWKYEVLPGESNPDVPAAGMIHQYARSVHPMPDGTVYAAITTENDKGGLAKRDLNGKWNVERPWTFKKVNRVTSVKGAGSLVLFTMKSDDVAESAPRIFQRNDDASWTNVTSSIPGLSELPRTGDAFLHVQSPTNAILWLNYEPVLGMGKKGIVWQYDGCTWSVLQIPAIGDKTIKIQQLTASGRSIALIIGSAYLDEQMTQVNDRFIETNDRVIWRSADVQRRELSWPETFPILAVDVGISLLAQETNLEGSSSSFPKLLAFQQGAIQEQSEVAFPTKGEGVRRMASAVEANVYYFLTRKSLYKIRCE